jgi:Phage integrase, N-terminal SAM-like domain
MTDQAISPLLRRMIEDMAIRKFAPKTQRDYVQRVKDFAAFLGRSPDTAKSEDVRGFRLHLASSGAGTPARTPQRKPNPINGHVTSRLERSGEALRSGKPISPGMMQVSSSSSTRPEPIQNGSDPWQLPQGVTRASWGRLADIEWLRWRAEVSFVRPHSNSVDADEDDPAIRMKPQLESSTQEVLAGLVERVTFHKASEFLVTPQ